MSALLRNLTTPMRHGQSLVSLTQYREAEATQWRQSSVSNDGLLLEYETLELRVHPPHVEIDNTSYSDRTVVICDSANRPGTLVEVVQCLTELGLNVFKARISSDGGWFVDEFHVSRVADERKLRAIKRVLSAEPLDNEDVSMHDSYHAAQANEETLFELAGTDRSGLLADVVMLLKSNGCDVRSAAVWTFKTRCAFVVSVLEQPSMSASGNLMTPQGQPLRDPVRLSRLKQVLTTMMDSQGKGDAVVNIHNVRGVIHFERRLHQLLLREEQEAWHRSNLVCFYEPGLCGGAGSSSEGQSSGSPAPAAPSANVSTAGGKAPLTSPDGGGSCGASSTSSSSEGSSITTLSSSSSAGSGAGGSGNHQEAAAGGPSTSAAAAEHGLWAAHAELAGARSSRSSASSQGSSTSAAAAPANGAATRAATGSSGMDFAPGMSVKVSATAGAAAADGAGPSNRRPSPSPRQQHQHQHQQAARQQQQQQHLGLPPLPMLISPKASKPEVSIQYSKNLNYWIVNIRCKDRKKLFFDTVCTLADLNYDTYHASVDVEGDWASQLFYVRTRYGDTLWDDQRAAKLKYMLEAAIQRRHPKGLKMHIQSLQRYDLAALTQAWSQAGLMITRAKVRPAMGADAVQGHTFYLMDKSGAAPDISTVQRACQSIGGKMMPAAEFCAGSGGSSGGGFGAYCKTGGSGAAAPPQLQQLNQQAGDCQVRGGQAAGALSLQEQREQFKFAFSVLQRTWGGSPSSIASS